MDNRARIAIAVVAVAAVVVAFVLASGSDEADTPTTTSTTTTATSPAGATEQTTPTNPAPEPEEVVQIEVQGGKPVDDVQRLSFEKGDRVRFDVSSDTADTVHVHGYDIERPVSAGGTVRFSFPASIEGIFEVELHSDETQIAEIEVNP